MPKCLHVWTCGAFRLDHVLQGHVLGIRSGRTCWSRHVGVYIHRKTPWPGRLVYFIFSEPNWEFSLCHYTPCYTPCMFRTVKSYPRVWAKNTCSTYSSHFQPFPQTQGLRLPNMLGRAVPLQACGVQGHSIKPCSHP